jgi:hypothetical protein
MPQNVGTLELVRVTRDEMSIKKSWECRSLYIFFIFLNSYKCPKLVKFNMY